MLLPTSLLAGDSQVRDMSEPRFDSLNSTCLRTTGSYFLKTSLSGVVLRFFDVV
jgi:hypothetical protein